MLRICVLLLLNLIIGCVEDLDALTQKTATNTDDPPQNSIKDSEVCTNGQTQSTSVVCGFNGQGRIQQLCANGAWTTTNICSDPDICLNDARIPGFTSCGLNNQGVYEQVCELGNWTATVTCLDSDVCKNGQTQSTSDACGFNSQGRIQQLCVNGAWTTTNTCSDPDVCSNGARIPGFTSCGLNNQGVYEQVCELGNWTATVTCLDPDICTNGQTQTTSDICGENNKGKIQKLCQTGKWVDSCVNADPCLAESCFNGVVCTNQQFGHTCGACPTGYTGNGKLCEKICDAGFENNENTCTSTRVSYVQIAGMGASFDSANAVFSASISDNFDNPQYKTTYVNVTPLDDAATVTINGINGNFLNNLSLNYGINEFPMKVSTPYKSSTYTLRIIRKAPWKLEFQKPGVSYNGWGSFSTGCASTTDSFVAVGFDADAPFHSWVKNSQGVWNEYFLENEVSARPISSFAISQKTLVIAQGKEVGIYVRQDANKSWRLTQTLDFETDLLSVVFDDVSGFLFVGMAKANLEIGSVDVYQRNATGLFAEKQSLNSSVTGSWYFGEWLTLSKKLLLVGHRPAIGGIESYEKFNLAELFPGVVFSGNGSKVSRVGSFPENIIGEQFAVIGNKLFTHDLSSEIPLPYDSVRPIATYKNTVIVVSSIALENWVYDNNIWHQTKLLTSSTLNIIPLAGKIAMPESTRWDLRRYLIQATFTGKYLGVIIDREQTNNKYEFTSYLFSEPTQ